MDRCLLLGPTEAEPAIRDAVASWAHLRRAAGTAALSLLALSALILLMILLLTPDETRVGGIPGLAKTERTELCW